MKTIQDKIDEMSNEFDAIEIAEKLTEEEKAILLEEVDDCTDYQAFDYGEPGYFLSYGKHTILFANWNPVSRYVQDVLEALGFELEWSDEWLVCDEGKAWRTSPDSYGWTPSYAITDDGEVITADCPIHYWTRWAAASDIGHPCRVVPSKYDLRDEEFFRWGEGETGWYPGQNDSPEAMLAAILTEFPDCEVVFQIESQGKFATEWSCWVRMDEGLREAWENGPEFLSEEEVQDEWYRLKDSGNFYEGLPVEVQGGPSNCTNWRFDGICWVRSGYVKGFKFVEFAWNPERDRCGLRVRLGSDLHADEGGNQGNAG